MQGTVATPQPARSFNADSFKRLAERLSKPLHVPVSTRPLENTLSKATVRIAPKSIAAQSIASKGKTKIIMTSAVAAQAARVAQVSQAKQQAYANASSNAAPDRSENIRRLLDMMSPLAGAPMSQENILAADALLRVLPFLTPEAKKLVAQRMITAERPSHAILSRLLADTNQSISSMLLEKCGQIPESELLKQILHGNDVTKKIIARRPNLSKACVEAFAKSNDPDVQIELIGNIGSQLTDAAFGGIMQTANKSEAVMSMLVTRQDLPTHVGAELFWHANPTFRTKILSRCLTDSVNVATVLRVLDEAVLQGREQHKKIAISDIYKAIQDATSATPNPGLAAFSGVTLCALTTIKRIFADKFGQAPAILLKAMGLSRSEFDSMLPLLLAKTDASQTKPSASELQSVFDSLSENKAKVLLTYWDWANLRAGPYAPNQS